MSDQLDSSDSTKTKSRKHVSKACLECRKRHFKCDGETPSCGRCSKNQKVCTYVESHRGGSRKKGVSRKNKDNKEKIPGVLPEIEDFPLSKTARELNLAQKNSNIRNISNNSIFDELYKLPCANDSTKCNGIDCAGKYAVQYFSSRPDGKPLDSKETEILTNIRKRIKLDHAVGNLDCLFANKEPVKGFGSLKDFDFGVQIHNPDNFIDLISLDQDNIVKKYYENFHNAHPFLPCREELIVYLGTASVARELLLIMKIVGDGETTNMYSKNVDLISDRLVQCLELVRQNDNLDLMTVQVLLLVSIIAHISSLHIFSKKIRHACVHLLQELEINVIDRVDPNSHLAVLSPQSDNSSTHCKVFDSPRLSHISKQSVLDNARRTFWELYFFDVIIGSADGRTVTTISSIPVSVNYPTYPAREDFDYKGRSEASKLVTESVKLNVEILEKKPFQSTLTRLKASISSWEMKLEDPRMYNSPSLIQKNGNINEGVHQAILMYNYAKIFVHRPFSLLWKINSPQNPKCGEDVLEAKDMPTQTEAESRAIIETRKTIEAATSITQVLIDTNAAKVTDRTPLFACALALASLVHISAYIWVENTLLSDMTKPSGLDPSELDIYSEYITLSLSAIYPISRHWILSGKLAKHIRESLTTLRPNLYTRLKDNLPQVEISIEKMTLGDSINDTSSEPDKSYSTESYEPRETSTSINSTSQTSASTGYAVDSFLDAPNSFMDQRNGIPTATNNFIDIQRNSISNFNGLFPGSDQFETIPPSGQLSPVSETGCDWIDKALLDYFDGENLVI
ncbi:MADS box transcription factor [Scheffersomyces xylosifermentans]|uniref:MADS box transcription factor n=1 Tax=Scheffersomyces xylosifermentans TaxID=1304137 RepID=UPI00315CB7DD